jgi:hypothetical protein
MGGGVGTDASRLQVLHSFANAHNPQQMQAAIDAARAAVQSQISARIGKNNVMQQMYGQNVPANAQNNRAPQVGQIPAGKFKAFDAKGNVVGYADDNKGTNYVAVR